MKVWLIRLTLLFLGLLIPMFALELGLNKLAPNSRAMLRKFLNWIKRLDIRGFPMQRENGKKGR